MIRHFLRISGRATVTKEASKSRSIEILKQPFNKLVEQFLCQGSKRALKKLVENV